mgnify:CR=1 FL=1
MNKKLLMPIVLLALLSLAVFVSAIRTEKSYPGTTVTAEFVEQNYHFYEGWNLVQGILNPEWVQSNSKNIKAIYAFNPITKEYVRFYPNPENNKIGGTNYQWKFLASIGALWVYSDKDFTSNYWKFADSPLTSTPLYSGWNFIGITSDMIDKTINGIKGSCNIERIYYWSQENQDWTDFMPHVEYQKIQQGQIGQGFVFKVSDNCKLGVSEGGVPSVPQLPDTTKTGCVDSDGGLTYIIKGKATDYSSNEILEDFCVNTIKLSEALCNNDGRGAYAQYDCPDGCYEGACIVPSCVLSAPFRCNQGNVKTNNIDIELQNVESESSNIKNVAISGCGSYSTVTFINTNELKTIKVPCNTALVQGTRFIGDITVTYRKMNGNLDLISSGRIVNQVK